MLASGGPIFTGAPERVMIGVTETFGGSGGPTRFESVTNVRWLPPTSANAARALVTIPPGYHQVNSPAGQ